MLGVGTFVDFLGCTQTVVPSLSVLVAPGVIYSQAVADAAAYGTLGTDSTLLMKQGLNLITQTLTLTAPTIAGQSQNYLIQVAYSDLDTNNQVLTYFNSTNPSAPYIGPGNTGAAQPTTRKGVCVVSLKAGTAATTGTQTTPAPDTSYTGLYVITLAYGQTTITNSQIVTLPTAPFITRRLTSGSSATPSFIGLAVSNDGASPNTVFDIAKGAAIDTTGTTLIKLATAFTKTLSSFATGTGLGSLDTGTVASGRWYFVHGIYNPATGASDILTSLSYTTPSLPAGYTLFVPIWVIFVNGSGNIDRFTQIGSTYLFAAFVTDVSNVMPPTSPTLVSLTVPTGVKVCALLRVTLQYASGVVYSVLITSPDEASAVPATNNGLVTVQTQSGNLADEIEVYTNTSGQIRVSSANASGNGYALNTKGFVLQRGAP